MKTSTSLFFCLAAIALTAFACGRKESADAPPKSQAMQSDADKTPTAAEPIENAPATAEPAATAPPAAMSEKTAPVAAGACNRDLDETQCKKVGGNFGPHGKAQMNFCICPASDSGKVCTDNSDCEGYCECKGKDDTEGRCSAMVNRFGCTCKMNHGKPIRICKD